MPDFIRRCFSVDYSSRCGTLSDAVLENEGFDVLLICVLGGM